MEDHEGLATRVMDRRI